LSGAVLLIIAYGLLLIGAAFALFCDKVPHPNRVAALFGAFCAAGAAVAFALADEVVAFADMFVFNDITRFACVFLTALLALWLLWISDRVLGRTREAVALALFSVFGAAMLASAREFITFLVALELTVMPSYILVGYWTKRRKGLEGALKYFLFSVMTTMIMGYGISLLYAVSGTTMVEGLDLSNAGSLGLIGITMLAIGLFAKVAAVPFHFWSPDAYSGAPGWAAAFVATVPKAGATVAFFSIISIVYRQSDTLPIILAVISALSMIVGAFAALHQKDIRRILAYSGIVNTGYTIIALTAYGARGVEAIVAGIMFTFFYATAIMGILMIAATEGDEVRDLAGLSKRRPAAAWALVIFLLSVIGVPPMAGFFGKLSVFLTGMDSRYWPLVIIATICSVVSTFYYLRLVHAAFFLEEKGEHTVAKGYRWGRHFFADTTLVLLTLMILSLGSLVGLLKNWFDLL